MITDIRTGDQGLADIMADQFLGRELRGAGEDLDSPFRKKRNGPLAHSPGNNQIDPFLSQPPGQETGFMGRRGDQYFLNDIFPL